MSKQYDRAAARASIDHLNRLASENGGKVPTWAVQASAAKLGVKERTVWRWLSDGVPEGISASLDSTTERVVSCPTLSALPLTCRPSKQPMAAMMKPNTGDLIMPV